MLTVRKVEASKDIAGTRTRQFNSNTISAKLLYLCIGWCWVHLDKDEDVVEGKHTRVCFVDWRLAWTIGATPKEGQSPRTWVYSEQDVAPTESTKK